MCILIALVTVSFFVRKGEVFQVYTRHACKRENVIRTKKCVLFWSCCISLSRILRKVTHLDELDTNIPLM